MADFLVFTLVAPFAAMGEIAVGERRASWSRPGRSAVFGLVAAALGLDRTDQDGHDALEAGYGLAIWTEAAGRPLSDYHTAQAPSAVAVKRFARALDRPPATRREELVVDEIETILSRREYRSDGLWLAAIWAREGARWRLETLADALRRPHFTPYFGRRACPFGLPLAPVVIESQAVEAAIHVYVAAEIERYSLLAQLAITARRGLPGEPMAELACDRDALMTSATDRIVRRRDVPGHRGHRLFAEREESVVQRPPALPSGGAGKGER